MPSGTSALGRRRLGSSLGLLLGSASSAPARLRLSCARLGLLGLVLAGSGSSATSPAAPARPPARRLGSPLQALGSRRPAPRSAVSARGCLRLGGVSARPLRSAAARRASRSARRLGSPSGPPAPLGRPRPARLGAAAGHATRSAARRARRPRRACPRSRGSAPRARAPARGAARARPRSARRSASAARALASSSWRLRRRQLALDRRLLADQLVLARAAASPSPPGRRPRRASAASRVGP